MIIRPLTNSRTEIELKNPFFCALRISILETWQDKEDLFLPTEKFCSPHLAQSTHTWYISVANPRSLFREISVPTGLILHFRFWTQKYTFTTVSTVLLRLIWKYKTNVNSLWLSIVTGRSNRTSYRMHQYILCSRHHSFSPSNFNGTLCIQKLIKITSAAAKFKIKNFSFACFDLVLFKATSMNLSESGGQIFTHSKYMNVSFLPKIYCFGIYACSYTRIDWNLKLYISTWRYINCELI